MSKSIEEQIFQSAKEMQADMMIDDPDDVMPLEFLVDMIMEGIQDDLACLLKEEAESLDSQIAAVESTILRSHMQLKQLQLKKASL